MLSHVGAGSARELADEVLAAWETVVVRFDADVESPVAVDRRVMMRGTDTALRCVVANEKTACAYDE
jgi:hypothetical protein